MIDFVLPSLGADMDEGMLVGWLVDPGDEVKYGQVIAEVETDKGIIEVECWHDGYVDELLRQPSPEKLAVGTLLARIRPREEAGLESPVGSKPVTPAPQPRPQARPKTTPPPVRHLAHTLGVDLDVVTGTGPDGSITRDDVRSAARPAETVRGSPEAPTGTGRVKATPRARSLAWDLGLDLATVPVTRTDGLIVHSDVESVATVSPEPEDRVVAMRRAITRSMSRSKREIPHYYLATQIDLHEALTWLEKENSTRSIASRILPAALLLKAAALAVREVPDLNGHWIDDRFVAAESVHLGVAISLREGGLVAPAIHHADELDLDQLMESLKDLVTRARSWRLRGSEMSDPTVTVTNLGDRGVETAFPVIIPPQVAMVGFGRVVDAVVAADGAPVVRPVVHASLAADHRVTDGHTGGLFLTALDRLLQKPEAL
jgi:pyruvate dehydrogenase E2 component (dihydrolipoamide acetyltransferase)